MISSGNRASASTSAPCGGHAPASASRSAPTAVLPSPGRSVAIAAMLLAAMTATVQAGGQTQDAQADAQRDRGEIAINVAGVQVVSRTAGEGTDALHPFNAQQPGTQVAVLVTGADPIVAVDQRRSTIQIFVDDRDTDLLEGEGGELPAFPWPRVSRDHQAALVYLGAPGTPAAGATRLHATGQLRLTTATGTQRVAAENIALQRGTQFRADGLELTIIDTGEQRPGDERMTLRLRYTGEPEAIAHLHFVDADGAEIDSRRTGWSTFTTARGETTVTYDYTLMRRVPEATIELDLWQNVQTRDIPFEIRTDLTATDR